MFLLLPIRTNDRFSMRIVTTTEPIYWICGVIHCCLPSEACGLSAAGVATCVCDIVRQVADRHGSFSFILLSTGSIQVPMALIPVNSDFNALPSRVEVRIVPTALHYATRVRVDPVTTEDWELLQIHAQVLENGALLKQVSILYQGQQLELRLAAMNQRQEDRIRVIVKELSITVDDMSSSPWPELSSTNSDPSGDAYDDEPQSAIVAILSSNTEIIVTPMPQRAEETFDPMAWSEPLQVIASAQDAFGLQAFSSSSILGIHKSTPKVSPGCVMVHPHSIPWDNYAGSGWAQIMVQLSSSDTTVKTKVLPVQLITSQTIPEDTAGTSLF